jgi:hypothetical protein
MRWHRGILSKGRRLLGFFRSARRVIMRDAPFPCEDESIEPPKRAEGQGAGRVAVRDTEKAIPAGRVASDLGQAVTVSNGAGGFVLLSYLTSPLTVGSRQDYAVFSLPSSTTPAEDIDSYTWSVKLHPSGFQMIGPVQTEVGLFTWTPKGPGDVRVSVSLDAGGSSPILLVMPQAVKALRQDGEDFINRFHGAGTVTSGVVIFRELINDVHAYIRSAVVGTEATGVPSSLVAASLYIEMLGRNREGTPQAESYRRALAEGRGVNSQGQLEKWFGREDDLIREVELELIADYINDGWRPVDAVAEKSIGLGQVQQVTGAMVMGLTTWREKPRGQSAGAETQLRIVKDYKALSLAKKIDVFNMLRFPKTSIGITTTLLAKLKNRPHRWPALTRAQMRANQRACEIVGTEYNIGARDSPASNPSDPSKEAQARPHGERVWKLMQPSSELGPDIFFPEPP